MSAELSIAGIDQVAFAAVRLESAREGFERLGFALTARGYCTWCTPAGERSAGSHSVIFDRCYLDMIEHDERRWRADVASSALYRCGLAPSAIVLRAHAVEMGLQPARPASRRAHDRYAPGLHHLAFGAPDRAAVDRVYRALEQLGVPILDPPASYEHYAPGYYAVFFADPAGIKLEYVFTPTWPA